GPDRAGTPNGASLVGVGARLSADDIRSIVTNGRGHMPAVPHITDADLADVVTYVTSADAAGRGGARGRGAGTGPAPTFPPGPVVQSGPSVSRAPVLA